MKVVEKMKHTFYLVFIGPCIVVIVEEQKTNVMSLFYFTSYVLNMFRTLIYPSSGACDYSVELPHGYHSNPTTPKLQYTSNQEEYDQCGNSTE